MLTQPAGFATLYFGNRPVATLGSAQMAFQQAARQLTKSARTMPEASPLRAISQLRRGIRWRSGRWAMFMTKTLRQCERAAMTDDPNFGVAQYNPPYLRHPGAGW